MAAAPTVRRAAVPEASSALSITAALGMTFPFNLVIGIPLYIALAKMERLVRATVEHPFQFIERRQ